MKVTINGHEIDVKKGDRIMAEIHSSLMETNRWVAVYRKVKVGKSKRLVEKEVIYETDF